MRLHFWACREAGIPEASPSFFDYYIKFIGHFVSVYERSATQFARESARWSLSRENTDRYLANGNQMDGVIGISYEQALAALPAEERSGNASSNDWPYVS